MIKQDGNYINTKKQFFLRRTIIWLVAILVVFIGGWIVTGVRGNVATIFAAVMTLGFAQNLTRYLAFKPFKDCDTENLKLIDALKGDVAIYHSVLIPTEKKVLYFDHVIVTKQFYFISSSDEYLKLAREYLINRLISKGINLENMNFKKIENKGELEKLLKSIDCTPETNKEALLNNITILEGMLM
ncbi:hypothetical protein AN639_03255 [Candidatus Epulonipiscium fishelsonii]|uniref:Uncharacterized protein n=1 Tax=Candidatus Epulonipiscium fishelsonii TaxID=77094 RepID=A0ACC8XGM1_9FIRM|nr:hypothetical protein AN639_03255 [Epulopiscium sp. SCG-B05WGA-EpuloA1]ONI42634.1 hypothetical protein AN396_13710 [Epulopiscium sp. SCG-B11WGA-EpuloA1]ONI47903.1 hypothetical protein AN644_03460 [Epulopiscium sp. SCG-C06WGA-EpuloA1]